MLSLLHICYRFTNESVSNGHTCIVKYMKKGIKRYKVLEKVFKPLELFHILSYYSRKLMYFASIYVIDQHSEVENMMNGFESVLQII